MFPLFRRRPTLSKPAVPIPYPSITRTWHFALLLNFLSLCITKNLRQIFRHLLLSKTSCALQVELTIFIIQLFMIWSYLTHIWIYLSINYLSYYVLSTFFSFYSKQVINCLSSLLHVMTYNLMFVYNSYLLFKNGENYFGH